MNERETAGWDLSRSDPSRSDQDHFDHWAMFADASDLTIEGHRLIAQEIIYESKLAWRAFVTWLRDLSGVTARRGSSRLL